MCRQQRFITPAAPKNHNLKILCRPDDASDSCMNRIASKRLSSMTIETQPRGGFVQQLRADTPWPVLFFVRSLRHAMTSWQVSSSATANTSKGSGPFLWPCAPRETFPASVKSRHKRCLTAECSCLDRRQCMAH